MGTAARAGTRALIPAKPTAEAAGERERLATGGCWPRLDRLEITSVLWASLSRGIPPAAYEHARLRSAQQLTGTASWRRRGDPSTHLLPQLRSDIASLGDGSSGAAPRARPF